MNNNLPCLTALVAILLGNGAIAQTAAVNGASSPPPTAHAAGPNSTGTSASSSPPPAMPPGDRLVAQAISVLERHESVTARLRHQAAIGGVELYGVGSYWQLGGGESLRVRMELQIAGQEASLLQVSNSRFLWIDRRLPTGRTVTRIDLRQLRMDRKLVDDGLETLEPGKATWSMVEPGLATQCGGLASLLSALGENFSFLPPQAMRLAVAPPLASEPMNIPVYAVVGHWKPEKLSTLTGQAGAAAADDGRGTDVVPHLPARLPQEVLLLVGQADLFPYRIEYRRLQTPRATDAAAPKVPYQLSASPLAVLELSDVTFDAAIQAGQFDYSPRDVDWDDRTAEMLERLRKQRGAQVATRNGSGKAR